jgi:hypothetical protein
MTNTPSIKIILASLLGALSLATAYAANPTFTVAATVAGGDAIYCPQQQGSGGNPNPGNCGNISFGTFTGAPQAQQTIVATVTTNNPAKDATLSIADNATPGSNYALKNTAAPAQTIPLAIQYTDCSGNNYGSITNSTPINGADISGSSISGTNPACTSYNTYPPSGSHGTFTFTLPTMATLPQDGGYTETLNVTIGSM